MIRVLVSIQQPVRAWQIPAVQVARLRALFPALDFTYATDPETRRQGLRECEVAFTWILSGEEVAAAPHLRWVHTSAVALETLALKELFARGITVSNSRAVQAPAIAEHALAVLLALSKRLPLLFDAQQQRRWAQHDLGDTRLPWLLRGRTLGLIGVGTIGAAIARLAAGFGMTVIAVRRRESAGPVEGVAEVLSTSQLDHLLARADAVVVAAPLTVETRNLFTAATFARMKPGAVFINLGRAGIVDHEALVVALRAGHLSGASLDVFPQEPLPPEHPLWSAPNIILTPHTSGFRHGHWDDVIDLFADNLGRYMRREPIRHCVDATLGY